MKRILLLVASLSSTSCAVLFQDSVSKASVYCSTSHFYYISDLLIAGAYSVLVARMGHPQAVQFLPAALPAADAVVGILRRGGCLRSRQTAPREEWAPGDAADA